MKLVKHGDTIVAVIEHNWEKAYLTACRGEQEWVPLFTLGSTSPVAEIDPVTRQVRMRVGYIAANVQEVVLHDR